MQEQLVHLFVDVQETKAQCRAEAAAQCEGRAQDRQIYLEAFTMAERFYEQKARQSAEECEGFLRGEGQEFSKRQAQEEATFRRLREHEVQKAHEYEMRANAATNQEASVSQERYMAQKEAFQWNSQREAAVAEVRQVTQELAACQQRHEQLKVNAANEVHHEAGVVRQVEAKWRQECQMQRNQWEK